MLSFSLDIGSTINNAISTLITGIIYIFISFFQGLVSIFLNAISSALGVILNVFGIPFNAWAIDVSQQGLIIFLLGPVRP